MTKVRRVLGIPLTQGLPAKSLFQQTVFIDSQTGSTDGAGGPQDPVSTLALAFSRNLVKTNGVAIIAAGHSEDIVAAGGIEADIAGVHVLGLGEGTSRPTFNFTTVVGADINISAANITFENLYFDATGVDALTGPIDVGAARFTYRNCEAVLADSGGQCSDFIVADASADFMTVEDSLFTSSTNAGGQSAIQFIGNDHMVIRNNTIYGDYVAGPIENVTTAATRILIENNDLDNYNASDLGIALVSTTDGTIRRNTIRIATNGQTTWITASGDCQFYENYGVNADDETGMLLGTASS